MPDMLLALQLILQVAAQIKPKRAPMCRLVFYFILFFLCQLNWYFVKTPTEIACKFREENTCHETQD